MIALIDADSIAYKYASIHQDTCIWGEVDGEVISSVSIDYERAVLEMEGFIAGILDMTDTDSHVLVLSPKITFRYTVAANYKGNRKAPKVKLEMLTPLRDHLIEHFGAICFDDVEADDVCVSRMYQEPGKYVLCHIDKDLNQAVGPHYNYNTRESYDIDAATAEYWFYSQILEGDSVDGIKGCPKIGKIKAARILASVEPEDWWMIIQETYEAAGMTYEYLLQQARLVYMLRDFNEETQEFALWLPE